MKRLSRVSVSFMEVHLRAMAGALAAVMLAGILVAVRHPDPAPTNPAASLASDGAATDSPAGPVADASGSQRPSVAATAATRPGALPKVGSRAWVPGKFIPGVGTIPRGITDNKIRVVYYWKGDQVMGSSQYLNQTGRQGDLDEGEAFRTLVDYINAHPNGDGEFMGFRFNLHGRRIDPHIVVTGKSDWSEVAFSEATAEILKFDPFAAISSHGSLSVDICPRLAKAGIHNFGTYDLGGIGGTLARRTKGHCYAQATSFEAQIEHSVAYLAKQAATTQGRNPTTGLAEPRKYGILYARYSGLKDVVKSVVQRLRKAGLDIPTNAVQSVSPSLTDSQIEAPGVVYSFIDAGVNTVISPDAGAPLNVTHAATAQKWFPDWFVWPCSGQDSTGMVRLYDSKQWENASGLTCYDPEFNSDLTNDDLARRTEWYKQYQSVAPGKEPPAPTPLVYQSLLPLLVGITNAGREVTVEKFRAGMAAFKPYRYSAVDGRTNADRFMKLSIGAPDGSLVADVARIRWDPTAEQSGGIRGKYVYEPPLIRRARGSVY